MATHQVQISVRRAARRSRADASLPQYIGLLAAANGVASAGMVLLAVQVLGLGWMLGALLGLAAALVGALCAAVLGARVSQALDRLAHALREMTLGLPRAHLPVGPGAEVARLSSAITSLSASIAGERGTTSEPLASGREPVSLLQGE